MMYTIQYNENNYGVFHCIETAECILKTLGWNQRQSSSGTYFVLEVYRSAGYIELFFASVKPLNIAKQISELPNNQKPDGIL